jgi:hypothetical protein
MKLLELLNTAVPYEVKSHVHDLYEEVAEINGRKIVFSAEPEYTHEDDDESMWEIAFLELRDNTDIPYTISKTGSGGELKVFSFIKDALGRFISAYRPTDFTFSADTNEPSRVKLYRAFVGRFKVPGYKMSTGESSRTKSWSFTKEPHAK